MREQIARPSPIRQIMKMAERQNILAMGLESGRRDFVWRRLGESSGARGAAAGVSSRSRRDPRSFHKSGGYTATLGDCECREQLARFDSHLFGVPRLGAEHIAIGAGSTQLTHDLFRALLDPGDTVMLLDPTYANYEGQLAFAAPNINIVRLRVVDPADVDVSADRRRPIAPSRSSSGCSTRTSRGS